LGHVIFLFSLQFSATLINLAQNGQMFYDNQVHKLNLTKMGKMFYDNCWAIRLIAALLLTFMSHIRPVLSPQEGFGGLGLPQQCTKTPQI